MRDPSLHPNLREQLSAVSVILSAVQHCLDHSSYTVTVQHCKYFNSCNIILKNEPKRILKYLFFQDS